MGVKERAQRAWNAFFNRDPTEEFHMEGVSSSYRPFAPTLSRTSARTILASVFNKIALDVSLHDFRHCLLDENERYKETISSGLNDCLTIEANKDQTGRALIQDIVISCLDEGFVGVVPFETYGNPKKTGSYSICAMRTAKILEWKPDHVKVRIYNDTTGLFEELWLPKSMVAIIENPLYAIINEPNSTNQRLKRKLSLLDIADEKTVSNKLDLLISLPYAVRGAGKRREATKRLSEIESQLVDSPHGIAYIDGTEKVTQLNRPLENNLLKTIEFLVAELFSQIGITQGILDGTADEKTMLNYYNRTIGVFVLAICDEFKRKFLTKKARTGGQSIKAFRDPFSLVPVNDMAEIADKFTRNEIMTSNEIRQSIGMKPSTDPKADQLVNSNISQSNETLDQIYNKGSVEDNTNKTEGESKW